MRWPTPACAAAVRGRRMPALAYAYMVRPEQSKPLMFAPLVPLGEQQMPYDLPLALPPPQEYGTPRWESAASMTVRTLPETFLRSGSLAPAVYWSIQPSTSATYSSDWLYCRIAAFSCELFVRSRPPPHR